MSEAMGRQREEWLSLVDDLNKRIKSLDAWLDERAKCDERVLRLQTHPGIGLLTSPALVHALEPVSRFGGGRKVAAYVGLDPMEYSSGKKQRCNGSGRSAREALACCAIFWSRRRESQSGATRGSGVFTSDSWTSVVRRRRGWLSRASS
jgi:transposase